MKELASRIIAERKRLQSQVTLLDVAQASGVSTATVSRVINQPERVRHDLRLRVQTVVAQLDYVPHGAARALASKRSRTVGAIVPTIDNAIFAKGIDALQQHLNSRGFVLLVASTEYDQIREFHALSAFIERGVDGIMIVGNDHDPQVYKLLAAKDVPFVMTWTYDPDAFHSCVGFDNRRAAMRVTAHLLDLGHRDFAMIAGMTPNNDRARDRVAGVREALATRRIELKPERLVERRYSISEGRNAMRMLMRLSTPPTAVICGNDVLAIGALLECQASGIKVPEKVSITGFDDLELSSNMVPPLTTLRVPCEAMGRQAAEHLVHRINDAVGNVCVELEVELILRGTTAPPAT